MTKQVMSKQQRDEQQDRVDPNLLQQALHQLLEQISKRDQKIARLNVESAAALRASAEKERAMLNTIAERDAILLYTKTQLKDRESQLDEILTSRNWKTALFLQQARVFLIPPNSRRAQVLRLGLDVILFPFKKIKRK